MRFALYAVWFHQVPITEDFEIHATNPYGQTKAMIEQILQDTGEKIQSCTFQS